MEKLISWYGKEKLYKVEWEGESQKLWTELRYLPTAYGGSNSAMRFLSDDWDNGILSVSDDVIHQLRQKHPEAQKTKPGTLFGPMEEVMESLYFPINGQVIREAALKTKGSGGPSVVDASGFKRILVCKSFNQSSTALCKAFMPLAKTLCAEYIDPSRIEALLASRLIPLIKVTVQLGPFVLAKC